MTKLLLAGARYEQLLGPFCAKRGCLPVFLPDNPNVSEPLAGHADLSVFPCGNQKLLLASYLQKTEIPQLLEQNGFTVCWEPAEQTADYPHDCGLNAVLTSHTLIYSPKATSPLLRSLAGERVEQIPVRQGYIRCSVIPVSEDAFITADVGIASALERNQREVLRITPGHVLLPGFPEGFPGGACFRMGAQELVFTGTLRYHPDADRITSFLERYQVRVTELDGPLLDIGGAFVLES